ncbi:hypothetical protein V1511DRAFT_506356 [Dipodascopsis uninucleata]
MSHPTSQRAAKYLQRDPRSKAWWTAGSALVMSLTGIISKTFLYGFHDVKVEGLKEFVETLDNARKEGRGIVTVSNHISVVDDPLLWGLLPFRHTLDPTKLRWCLGAENICFVNKVTSMFFGMGQVLSTKRFGAGPFQDSVDVSVYLLSKDRTRYENAYPPDNLIPQWMHIFPEALVHQAYPPHKTTMKYFHWGASRLVLEPDVQPVVIPIFHYGLDDVFPEDRTKFKYIPRSLFRPSILFPKKYRQKLGFKFGSKLDDSIISKYREHYKLLRHDHLSDKAWQLRSEVAASLREAVSDVRTSMGCQKEDPEFKKPTFWKDIHDVKSVKVAGKYGNSIKFIEREG